jgi:type IV pilus assembly protein PilO
VRIDFQRKKTVIFGTLAILVVGDIAMATYSIRMASSTVSPQQEIAKQTALLKLLAADVKRAHEIQEAMPTTKADCERFENSLPPAGSGYSVISAEMEDVGRKAGLQIASLSFHPKELGSNGITEVVLDASVSGNYKSVVEFLNGLQRSKNHYIVDDLSLANDRAQGGSSSDVRVDLHLRSYFKAMA